MTQQANKTPPREKWHGAPRKQWQAKLEWRSAMLRAFVRDYEWIHIGIGLFGNLLFFIGSVFFLWSSWQAAGVWLFILGSFAMLLGSLGDALVRWERRISRRSET